MFLDEPTTGLDPRSRNQVWDIVRALIGEGTTVLLCTQYLEEADQLADRIAVIDHGRVIAEGTPAQLKASVGRGALHVRLLDPDQRPRAPSAARRRRSPRARPGRAVAPGGGAEQASEAIARARRPRRRRRRLLARPAEPGRGVPGPHRPPRRGRDEEVSRMSATEPRRQPRRSSPRSTPRSSSARAPAAPRRRAQCLTFGWRGMLKIKHVPEQLIDVTLTPVLFLLMFTYLFGGAVAGSTGDYLQFLLPGMLVQSVLFVSRLLGRGAQHGHDQGRRRPLPLAADLAPRAAGRRGRRRQRPLRRRVGRSWWCSASIMGFEAGRRRGRACSPRSR